MPVFDVTPTQRAALDALEWLYSDSPEERRSGRSWVLAMSYVRRLVFGSTPGSGYLDVEDHVQLSAARNITLEYIRAIAHQIELDIEVDPRGLRVRLARPLGQQRASILEALATLGDRDDPGPPPNITLVAARRRQGRKKVAEPSAPQKSMWDLLDEDLTGV